ncbi:BTAD domain-containing putative transcriptional regulator [Streptomyces sp. V1I1]|uniref:BTAD domain-containing putative transcriptional regulator n=1 Tax=Streptomyces sp. V1I1 TaxID=3042272 RepID=UPI0027850A96|nr:BTAD domain-containing putative transcriptional regulator [Streptomyces sp. V1I1]MDQ0938367.1 DNA-binding SARP family transcriptional activator [Streptomyces sp. V1I1]
MSVRIGERNAQLGSPKQRALFALLLISAGKVVSVSTIISSLWGAEPPNSVTGTLCSYVSRLRRALGCPAAEERKGTLAIRYEASGYVLDVDPEHTDVSRFQTAVEKGRVLFAQGDLDAARRAMADALELWVGTPYSELAAYDFACMESMRLEQLRLLALQIWADACLGLGQYDEVVWKLDKEVRRNPMLERLGYQLMLAQYHSGQPAEAVLTYERIRSCLATELGTDTSKELQELHQAVLRQDLRPAATAAVTPQPSVPPRAEPLATVAEPADGCGSVPAVTPRRPGRLVGRARELARLRAVAGAAGYGRTLLVVGERGVGKTRLLQEFARDLEAAGTEMIWAYCAGPGETTDRRAWQQVARKLLRTRADRLGTLSDALRDWCGPEGERPGAADSPAGCLIFQALVTTAASAPLVLFLEDLNTADDGTLQLLQWMAREACDTQLLVIATVREHAVSSSPVLRRALARLLQEDTVDNLHLSALSLVDTGAVIAQMHDRPLSWDVVSGVHRRTGGNPYLLTRLLTAVDVLDDPEESLRRVPFALRVVLQSWLADCHTEVMTVLEICAVIGPVIDRRLLTHILQLVGSGADAVHHAFQTGLVLANPADHNDLYFAHGLMREQLLSELDPVRRAQLHHTIAQALSGYPTADGVRGAAGEDIAYHCAQAAQSLDLEEAVQPLIDLADQAERRLQYAAARSWLWRALAILRGCHFEGIPAARLQKRAAWLTSLICG